MFGKLLIFSFMALALADQKTYDGYKVLRTDELTSSQATAMSRLMSESVKYDFWKNPVSGAAVEVMSAPEDLSDLVKFLVEHGIGYSTKMNNVQEVIETSREMKGSKLPRLGPKPKYNLDWNDYYSHDDINEFIDELAATYDYVSTASIGQSYEGRDMRVIQIAKAGPGKPNIFVEAGIHAREWIANAVATYTIMELVENYDAHPQYVDNFNIHIIPLANPDGYEYSRTNERLWRKSRNDNPGSNCKGVDLNRNWPYHWGESGISTNPCSDVYLGSEPVSEIESKNIQAYFNTLNPKPQISVCFHSAAELWLYPYGYDYNQYPPNVDEIIDMAEQAVAALNAVHGQTFRVINSAELYPAAGASDDWYMSEGSRFTYTPELRDNGFGFLLPPELIIPSGEEIWAAWEVMFNYLLNEQNEN